MGNGSSGIMTSAKSVFDLLPQPPPSANVLKIQITRRSQVKTRAQIQPSTERKIISPEEISSLGYQGENLFVAPMKAAQKRYISQTSTLEQPAHPIAE